MLPIFSPLPAFPQPVLVLRKSRYAFRRRCAGGFHGRVTQRKFPCQFVDVTVLVGPFSPKTTGLKSSTSSGQS
jgi:hypothetical protein